MGWQDVIGGALGGVAGDPYGFSRNKLEQAFKQFQMQKMTNDLEMQREMHGMEKQKLDILLKQKQREEELENSPIGGILKIFGVNAPEGSEGVTLGQAKYAAPVAQIFQKQGEEYAPIPNTTALYEKKSGKVKETGLEGSSDKTQLVGHTPDGLPVIFNPTRQTQTVDGKPYTGKVIPKAEYPNVTFVGTVPGSPNQAVTMDRKGNFTTQQMPSPITGKEVKPLPDKAMNDLQGALDAIEMLDQLEKDIDSVAGIPVMGGLVTTLKSYGGNEAAQRWKANSAKLKADAQTVIKGIPSNFDVQTFIDTLPKEKEPASMGKKRIGVAKTQLINTIKEGIQNYENSNMQIPAYMKDRANKILGVGATYTQEDLEYTAKKHGISVEEVKQRLGAK